MGSSVSVAGAGQTINPRRTRESPRKTPVKESVLLQEELTYELDAVAKSRIFDSLKSKFIVEFAMVERGEFSQREKARFLDDLYEEVKRLSKSTNTGVSTASEYVAQYSPRKIDPKKHERERFCERPEDVVAPRFKEAYDGERTVYVRGLGEDGVPGTDDVHLKNPGLKGGMAFFLNGDVVFSDTGNDRLVILRGTDGQRLGSFGTSGSKPGQLNKPTGVAVSKEGLVLVADTGNHRLQVFSREGKYVKTIGLGLGRMLGEFNKPTGVAFSKHNTIAVADSGNHRIQLIRFVDGVPQFAFGGCGKENGMFSDPRDVSFWNDGMIAVADYGNNRVQIHFMLDGSYERTIGMDSFGIHVNGVGPTSVAVDKFENIAIACARTPSTESCVLIYDRFGEGIGQLLRGSLKSEKSLSIACDPSSVGAGTYAVADPESHTVLLA
jgi:DNA-binding beta-propeller fold protein YncE